MQTIFTIIVVLVGLLMLAIGFFIFLAIQNPYEIDNQHNDEHEQIWRSSHEK